VDRDTIISLDRAHVWHPYTPMDAWAHEDPIVVSRAHGVFLHDVDGRRYIDGNSSWYVAALGHGHPRLLKALQAQAQTLAHCALAGITHEPAARLAQELVALAPPGMTRVFYVDDGSTAVDAAIKICVQARKQLGEPKRTRFVALEGAFHGDSVGATSLGGIDVFRRMFSGVTFECVHAPFPEPDAYARALAVLGRILTEGADTIAAVFIEPIVQGAAGMRVYQPALLTELRALCDRYDVWLVTDEVFSGYGRTGRMWGSEHADVSPDLMCIGKAMAAIVPMGAVLAGSRVFDAFGGGRERAFLHGHTFCGNPIGAALALEVLAIYRDERVLDQVAHKAPIIAAAFERMSKIRGVERVRSFGMTGAADLVDGDPGYHSGIGWRVYDEARKRGAYLRPLGNTVYVCPPLVIDDADLRHLLGILEDSVVAALSS